MGRTQKNKATEYHLGQLKASEWRSAAGGGAAAYCCALPAAGRVCMLLAVAATIRWSLSLVGGLMQSRGDAQAPDHLMYTCSLHLVLSVLQAKLAKLRTQLQEPASKVRDGGGAQPLWLFAASTMVQASAVVYKDAPLHLPPDPAGCGRGRWV